MKRYLSLTLLLLILIDFNKNKSVDLIIESIEVNLGNEWYVKKHESGFTAYFCRTCNQKYLDSLKINPVSLNIDRYYFFDKYGPDSVSYYTTVSFPPQFTEEEELEWYKKNGVLKIRVDFEETWSKAKFKEIYLKNDSLKNEILKESLSKSNESIFADYRYWLPEERWKKRTQMFDFYFQKLPYSSKFINCSIFIDPSKPEHFCAPLLTDNTSNYWNVRANYLEDERRRALIVISEALGIKNYKIIH
jgi:hypothetical protein